MWSTKIEWVFLRGKILGYVLQLMNFRIPSLPNFEAIIWLDHIILSSVWGLGELNWEFSFNLFLSAGFYLKLKTSFETLKE